MLRIRVVQQGITIGLYAVLSGLEEGCAWKLRNVNRACSLETNDRAIRILEDDGMIIAPDDLWPVLVFLAALAIMASLRAMESHIAEWLRQRLREVVR